MRRSTTIVVILLCIFSMIVIPPSEVSSLTGWEWEEMPPMSYPARGIAETYNDEIYHIGGEYIQVYTYGNNTWWVRGSTSE